MSLIALWPNAALMLDYVKMYCSFTNSVSSQSSSEETRPKVISCASNCIPASKAPSLSSHPLTSALPLIAIRKDSSALGLTFSHSWLSSAGSLRAFRKEISLLTFSICDTTNQLIKQACLAASRIPGLYPTDISIPRPTTMPLSNGIHTW